MKKTIALLLTFLLLFTMMPLGSVQAMPGKGRTATAGLGRGTKGDSRGSDRDSRDKRARSEDKDRDSKRSRYRSKSEDRDRGRDSFRRGRGSLRAESIQDPYGSPRGVQDPIHIAQDPEDRYKDVIQDHRLQEEDQNTADSENVYGKSASVGSTYFNHLYVKQFFDSVDDKFCLAPEQYERYKRNEPELRKLNDNAWGWLIRFVQLGALLNISFEPDAIEAAIQDARSNKWVSRLVSNRWLIQQYGIEKLQVYAKEFDTMLKEYIQRMKTLDPEVRDPRISDVATALAYVATVAAVTIYDNAEFDGLTREQCRGKIKSTVVGNYFLTRDMFHELPNEVAIRRGSGNFRYTEVISGARYTTDIITITPEEIKSRKHYNQIYEERVQPLTDLLDRWDTELEALKANGTSPPHADLLSDIQIYLTRDSLDSVISINDGITICTISYNNQVQGITIGSVLGSEYHIEYSFTAPHNILANEGTYQGATNHLVSSVIRHIFDTYQQVTRVTADIVNPYNVKSGLRLGFTRKKEGIKRPLDTEQIPESVNE